MIDAEPPVAGAHDEPLHPGEALRLAAWLRQARLARQTLPPLSLTRRLRLDDAYRVQDEITALRLAAGERRIGWKLGFTSAAMRKQMGVGEPNAGPLTDAMLLPDGAPVPAAAIQPLVEPEIALVIGRDGLPVGARAALEVVDSIWDGYRFTLADNTADGSSAGWVVLGPGLGLERLDRVRVRLHVDGKPVATGSGADVLGHPYHALEWLRAHLAQRSEHLSPGDIVMTGGLTGAISPTARVVARFGHRGREGVDVSLHGR